LACAWPLMIGQETLRLLRTGNVSDPERRIKVARSGVRRIMFQTVFAYRSKRAWERLAKDENDSVKTTYGLK